MTCRDSFFICYLMPAGRVIGSFMPALYLIATLTVKYAQHRDKPTHSHRHTDHATVRQQQWATSCARHSDNWHLLIYLIECLQWLKTEPCSVFQSKFECDTLQAEDSHLSIDSGRRKQSLQMFLNLISLDLEREQKSLDGIQKLVEVYHNKPTFADTDTRDEVNQRHANVCSFFL